MGNPQKKRKMIREIVKMKCDGCGHVFEAPVMELNATSESVAVPCPKCGGTDTKRVSENPLKKIFRRK